MSLHANAAPRRALHGIETYYPDANHERHSLRVAARENGVSRSQLNALQRTLAKLRVGEVSPQSRRLAEHVQQELVTGLPREYRPVADLGVKKGPFYVLFLSSMPSVLVESGFVTHAAEAKRLRDDRYVAALAEQIARGPVRLPRLRASAVTARAAVSAARRPARAARSTSARTRWRVAARSYLAAAREHLRERHARGRLRPRASTRRTRT